jgi:NTP pyrophosphatase (non-canonical NTP hydrolase)
MHLSELCKLAHRTALEKGFWEQFENGTLKPRNISELLMLIVSELGEACEALRTGKLQGGHVLDRKGKKIRDAIWLKDTFSDEIADVFIRLGDMCQALGIDIEWQIKKKMSYNKEREFRHGKLF